jgi:O-antigen ligase
MPGVRHPRRLSSTLLFLATAATLLLALFLGGGQGSRAEDLLALAGLGLIAAAVYRASTDGLDPRRRRWILLLPLALVALPLLQLVPLPPAVWTHLPGRAALVADLQAAGVTPGWAPLSLDARATERVLYSLLVPIGLFMAAAVLRHGDRRRLVHVVLGFAGFSAFLGLWQLMQGPDSRLYFWEITNRGSAVGFFANRNHLASLLAVGLPLTMGLLADRLRQRGGGGARDLRLWLLSALIVVLAVGVTATVSRAGFALLMLSLVAGAVVLWRSRQRGEARGARIWVRLAAGVAALLILQFTLYALLLRLQADPLDDYRFSITPNTLAAAAPARGTGFGFGSFVQAYDEVGDVAADMTPYVNHAHNDYAEVWLEGGLPALLLGALGLAWVVRGLWRQLRALRAGHDPPWPERGLVLGATLGLVLLGLHSAVDYPLRTLTLASVAALLASIALGAWRAARAAAVAERRAELA